MNPLKILIKFLFKKPFERVLNQLRNQYGQKGSQLIASFLHNI